MANHCINKVRVLGVKGDTLSEIMSVFKDGGFKYEDEVHTEYDDAFDCVRSKPNEVYFCTRWVPPLYFIQSLSEKYTDAIFDIMYSEPGFEVFGHEKYLKGFCYWENESLYRTGNATRSFDLRLYNSYNKYLAANYNKEVKK